MEGGSEKGFSPLKSTASPRISTSGSGENNENDSSQYQMVPEFQKKMVTTAPRRKILGVRNDNSVAPEAQNDNVINLDVKKNPQYPIIGELDQDSPWVVPSYSYTSESDDKGDNVFSDDSLAKEYDPLTNYLSPRPTYLRFNPNRRSEILNRLENVGVDLNDLIGTKEVSDEEMSSLDGIEDSSFPRTNESFVEPKMGEKAKQEDEICSDECDEEEEEEESKVEKGGCLRGVVKHMLMLIACLLLMLYICPMDSPVPSPAQQCPWNLTDGYLLIQKQTLQIRSYDPNFLGVKVGDKLGAMEEVKIDGAFDGWDSKETVEANEEVSEGYDEVDVGNDNEDGGFEFKAKSSEQWMDDKTDEGGDDEVGDQWGAAEELKIDGAFDGWDSKETVEANEEVTEGYDEEDVGNDNEDGGFEFKAESSEQWMDDKTDEGGDDADSLWLEKEVRFVTANTEVVGMGETESEAKDFGQLADEKSAESDDAAVYALKGIEEDLNREFQFSVESKDDGTLQEEVKQNNGAESSEELPGLAEKLTDSGYEYGEIGYDNKAEIQKLGWSISAVIGVLIGSLLLVALGFVYSSKKGRNNGKESKSAVQKKKKPQKIAEEEKVVTTTLPPSMDRKVEFLARPAFAHSAKEAPREVNHHIHAPTVELIGEIVVGGRRSLGNSGTKLNMTEFKDSNATYFMKHSLPQPVSTPIQTSALTHSANLPFHGSIATEKKKVHKKEGGQSGEASAQGTTYLRRSSRLRSRAAAMSP